MADWIIVVDDDPSNLKIAGHILSERGMRVTALKSGAKFLEYIRENGTPDIVLLDILMPGMDGFEVLVHLRELENELGYPETPVVFLTADEDRNSEMRGFQMGVSDFIHKPFDPEILLQRISNVIANNKRMLTIEEEAARDKLTGFLNKEATREAITGACLNSSGCLCILDLDSFKLVNDMYGHDMGDRVLVNFAEIIKENINDDSIVGRIGGDEFLLFGNHMQREDDVKAFTVKINDGILESAYQLMGEDMRIPLGVSVGAVSVPQNGTDYDELFQMADKALYKVKDHGKHGYVMYSDDIHDDTLEKTNGVMDLNMVTRLLEERSIPQSVMWMGREAFGNVYRYMMRYFERYEIPAYKALFTIEYKSPDVDKATREITADALREVIQISLRNSDIMVQTGEDQFFLLLPELMPEHVDRVIGRMSRAWSKNTYSEGTELKYEYASVAEFARADRNADTEGREWIVVVDDNGTNLKMAEHILAKENMKVTCLRSGQELLDFVQDNNPDLILLDINMPGMDGFETMRRMLSRGGRIGRIPIILLTANDDDATEAQGFAMGAMDFIRKPFVPEILIMRVKHAVNMIRLQNNLKSEVNEKIEENEQLSIHIIKTLASAIDAKDLYTSGHSERVAEYSRMIAEHAGYDEDTQDEIYMLGLLHDVGKIGISDAIINKKGKLDDAEYEEIKTHPVKGAKILENIPEMPELVTGARWHHERFDGKGYPDGLSGKDIPSEARIIAVADSYDAMTSRRSYRDALPQEAVKSELEKGRGTQFDPKYADIMLELMEDDPDYNMREKPQD